MSPINPEPSRPDFSHWPWHGWVENSSPAALPQLVEKDCPAPLVDRKRRIEDQEWETLILRLF